MLQALAVEGGPAGGGAHEEAPGPAVGRGPQLVADALETEHGVEGVERDHGYAVIGVGGGCGQPGGDGPGLGDALLEDLAAHIFPVPGDGLAVLWFVQLTLGGVDAQLPEQPFHAEGAGLVGDYGHNALADLLVLDQGGQQTDKGHGGRQLALARAFEQSSEAIQGRGGQRHGAGVAERDRSAHGLAPFAKEACLWAVIGRADEGQGLQLVVLQRHMEAVAEDLERLQVHLLDVVGHHHRFAGLAHAEALDRLHQQYDRPAPVADGSGKGGMDLARVVAAPAHLPQLAVTDTLDQPRQGGVVAKQLLAQVGRSTGMDGLEVAINHLRKLTQQQSLGVAVEDAVPLAAPEHLDHLPAGAAEAALQFLDDLAVAAHRTIQPLQVAVDHEDQVIEPLAGRQGQSSQGLGLVGFAVTHEYPDLAVAGRLEASAVQVAHEPGLVDRRHRPQTHGDGGELPELGHQPGVRIGGEPQAVRLLAEMGQLLLAEPALDKGAGVDAGRAMALEVDQVGAAGRLRAAEEPVETNLVQGRDRGVGGDVSAQPLVALVGPGNHGHGVPAHEGGDVAGEEGLLGGNRLGVLGQDGVAVGSENPGRGGHAPAAGAVSEEAQQMVGLVAAFGLDDAVQRGKPVAGFGRIGIGVVRAHGAPPAEYG